MFKKFIFCFMLILGFGFTFPSYAADTVKFQFEKLEEPFSIDTTYADPYLYELGMNAVNNCIGLIKLNESGLIRIFGTTEVKESDLYREILYVNQATTKAGQEYGFTANALFDISSYNCSSSNIIENPIIYISPSFRYVVFDDEIENLKKIFDDIGVYDGMPQRKAIAEIGSFVVNHLEYDMNILSTTNRDVWDILNNKYGICYDYANTFRFLARLCGIEAYYVTGETSVGLHAWNYSIVDGEKIYTDCTWQEDSKGWLMRSEEGFIDHVQYEAK